MSSSDTVYAALPTKGSGVWAHPRTVADECGMGYSTATRWLRQLVADGKVEARKDGLANVYRRTGRAVTSVDALILSGAEAAESPAPSAEPAAATNPRTEAGPDGPQREPNPKPDRSFRKGELRDLVLSHLRGLAAGADATAGEIGRAIQAPYIGPISSNLVRMANAGVVVQTSAVPARYRAV